MSALATHQPAPDPAADALATRADVVMVGAGPVGMHFLQRFSARQPHASVIVYSDEPRLPYDRVRLSSFLADAPGDAAALALPAPDNPNIDLRPGQRVTDIEPDRREITDSNEVRVAYGKLILATGSRPRLPGIPGLDRDGVYTFRDLADAESLAARRLRSRCTVIIGGGLLGLETARAMRRFNTRIVVVEHAPHLMFSQLDDDAAALLERSVRALGIEVRTGVRVTAVKGDARVSACDLSDGTSLVCDTVVVAAGIVPNVELARRAGIRVSRGIEVDDTLRTSAKDIYAIGECAEHRGVVYGLVQPGFEQASVLVETLHDGPARYAGSALATRLKVLSVPVFSAGDMTDRGRPVDVLRHGVDADRYRMVKIVRGRLSGACAVGAWTDNARLEDHVRRGAVVWPWQRWRFQRTGFLWPEDEDSAADWPASAIICNCTGMTRGAIAALPVATRTSADSIAASTRASTVCGSCRPLLEQIAGGGGAQQPAPAWAWLAGMSLLVGALAAAWALLPGAGYSESVQSGFNVNQLWYHTALKEWSGYSLMALAGMAALLSLRKRLPEVTALSFPAWRLVHVLVGLLLVAVLFVHTGFRSGNNLNAWLTACFVLALFSGAVLGGVIAAEHQLRPRLGRVLRGVGVWVHVLVLWPLPVLLGFHVLKTYYF